MKDEQKKEARKEERKERRDHTISLDDKLKTHTYKTIETVCVLLMWLFVVSTQDFTLKTSNRRNQLCKSTQISAWKIKICIIHTFPFLISFRYKWLLSMKMCK